MDQPEFRKSSKSFALTFPKLFLHKTFVASSWVVLQFFICPVSMVSTMFNPAGTMSSKKSSKSFALTFPKLFLHKTFVASSWVMLQFFICPVSMVSTLFNPAGTMSSILWTKYKEQNMAYRFWICSWDEQEIWSSVLLGLYDIIQLLWIT